MSRLLELENGERIDQPTEAQIIEAFGKLDAGNSKLVLQRAPFEILVVIREFQNRYHFIQEKKGQTARQSIHPVSSQIAGSSVQAYMSGDDTWRSRVKWEKVTAENSRNVSRQISIESMDDEMLEKQLARVGRQIIIFGAAFCLMLLALLFFLDIGNIRQWDGDQFNLALTLLLPLWLAGAGFVMNLKRRRLILSQIDGASDQQSG